MKILLDENVHSKLKFRFPGHEVTTVRDMGWLGKRNGELMQLILNHEFNVLITLDKGFEHQQNFGKYPVPVLLLEVRSSKYEFLLPLVDKIRMLLSTPLSEGITRVSFD